MKREGRGQGEKPSGKTIHTRGCRHGREAVEGLRRLRRRPKQKQEDPGEDVAIVRPGRGSRQAEIKGRQSRPSSCHKVSHGHVLVESELGARYTSELEAN